MNSESNREPDKDFLDSLNLSLAEAWKLLGRGSKDRKSPLHMLCVGTVSPDGQPRQRIMVLREVNREQRRLRFHTDNRADKIDDIGTNAKISVLAYHPQAKVQMRISGTARIEIDTLATDAAWNETSLFGKRCYLAQPGPGTSVETPTSGLDPAIEGRKPDEAEVAPARKNFAIMIADIDRIEWLYLAHTGHRRAEFIWDGADWNGQWLVP